MKKQRVFREEIKDKHTSHWDLDMMTREELEAVMGKKAEINQSIKDSDQDPQIDK